jgi:DNA modification methylase
MADYLARGRVHIGDVLDLAGRLEPASVQTIVTSPPYWGLRSYLPADHPDKAHELGSEATPEQFVANLVRCSARCGRR